VPEFKCPDCADGVLRYPSWPVPNHSEVVCEPLDPTIRHADFCGSSHFYDAQTGHWKLFPADSEG
jgi:hypothetical protein